ncbi:MAG: 16S rRNA (guanine(966)-N(2))-methyltransferase RsmD [Acetatifactor sp.]|nr:16S rRNA (guanine(966)-N(2))-methyltransferase RsmD [Acetatifactor sp.]
MRVIAGTARSLPLKTPEGLDTRPTTDRIKETLFNILHWDVQGAVFVDLFSGSGAIGIEALSRGARKAYFVDNAARAIECIQKNLTFTKLQNRAIVIRQEACSGLSSIHETAVDIIFMDPPYDQGHEKNVLAALKDQTYVTEDTLIIVEASLDTDFSWLGETGFVLEKEKRYKTNKHMFIRKILL